MSDLSNRTMGIGCIWVVATHKGADEFCHRLPEAGKPYCPKHQLMHDEAPNERKRRAEARKKSKAYQKEQEEALAASPLAAVNPKFEKEQQARQKARRETKQVRRKRRSRLVAAV
jgi:hypothetical protein